jgi:hypothetical protein
MPLGRRADLGQNEAFPSDAVDCIFGRPGAMAAHPVSASAIDSGYAKNGITKREVISPELDGGRSTRVMQRTASSNDS